MYLERLRLDGRTAWITGGARGIGLAAAEALAEAGARVTIADRDESELAKARAALAAKGFEMAIELMDVTRPEEAAAVADRITAREGRLDILINNA
ncbi:MAG TPA: SDR family NAD(P)-dependent oxidoreductase, partial [Caulobacteraceae bacterium]|nr:SDR family NAD(P)-dependent oxidoreductase [Caulobacteraceae bacterium]